MLRTADELMERLTPRQREVLHVATRGLTNSEIGDLLGISNETVRTHLAAAFRRLEVSNRTEAAMAWHAWEARTESIAEVLRRPAIAVLPILTLDTAPGAATLAAGLTRDLSDLFSRWCWFPVIGLTSSRDARSLGVTSQAIGEALGARFLVDATLRASPTSWRLVVCIADVDSGCLAWSETFDFACGGLFAVQDQVSRAVVAAAYPRLVDTVHATLARPHDCDDPQAWTLAHRAFVDYQRRDHDGNVRARDGFDAAIALDASLVLAHFGRGLVAFDEVQNQWAPLGLAAERVLVAAERCVELAPHMAAGHFLHARYQQSQGDHHHAGEALERAISHNPSFSAAHSLLGQTLLLSGRPAAGLKRIEQAYRLNPRAVVAGRATALYACERFDEALRAAEEAIVTHPRYPFLRVIAAASAWWLDDRSVAIEHVRNLNIEHPTFDADRFLNTFGAGCRQVQTVSRALELIAAHG